MTKFVVFYVILELLMTVHTLLHICAHTFTHLLQLSYAANYNRL